MIEILVILFAVLAVWCCLCGFFVSVGWLVNNWSDNYRFEWHYRWRCSTCLESFDASVDNSTGKISETFKPQLCKLCGTTDSMQVVTAKLQKNLGTFTYKLRDS